MNIVDSLGVYPDIKTNEDGSSVIKLIVCVEGPFDAYFFMEISSILSQEDASIINLRQASNCLIIPLGGGNLKEWANYNYLKKLKIPEFHIYDSDNQSSHQQECDVVNARGDGSSARMTRKRELENYFHKDAIKEFFDVDLDIDDTMDVSTEISNKLREVNPEAFSPNTVKKKLNTLAVKKMNRERLEERDENNEIISWLREISGIVNR